MSKVKDILLIADAPQLGAEGTATAAIKLFEAQVMSGLLFNCESWIGITEAQINELQSFQDNFLNKLLHLPVSTPKAILHWDCGMEMVKWRIAKIKLMFVRKMRQADCDNICKRALINEIIIGTKGLSSECKELADEISSTWRDTSTSPFFSQSSRSLITISSFEDHKFYNLIRTTGPDAGFQL